MTWIWTDFNCCLAQVCYNYVNTPVFLENSSFTWKVSTVIYCIRNFDFWLFWSQWRRMNIWSLDYDVVLMKRPAGLRWALYVMIKCISVYSRWFYEEIYASSVGGILRLTLFWRHRSFSSTAFMDGQTVSETFWGLHTFQSHPDHLFSHKQTERTKKKEYYRFLQRIRWIRVTCSKRALV